MTVTAEIKGRELADLVKQVRAGNEILLTQDSRPVAKLVPAADASRSKVELTIVSGDGLQPGVDLDHTAGLLDRMDSRATLPHTPRTLGELEQQLLHSAERFDRGEGVDGEELFRRLRKRMKNAPTDA